MGSVLCPGVALINVGELMSEGRYSDLQTPNKTHNAVLLGLGARINRRKGVEFSIQSLV